MTLLRKKPKRKAKNTRNRALRKCQHCGEHYPRYYFGQKIFRTKLENGAVVHGELCFECDAHCNYDRHKETTEAWPGSPDYVLPLAWGIKGTKVEAVAIGIARQIIEDRFKDRGELSAAGTRLSILSDDDDQIRKELQYQLQKKGEGFRTIEGQVHPVARRNQMECVRGQLDDEGTPKPPDISAEPSLPKAPDSARVSRDELDRGLAKLALRHENGLEREDQRDVALDEMCDDEAELSGWGPHSVAQVDPEADYIWNEEIGRFVDPTTGRIGSSMPHVRSSIARTPQYERYDRPRRPIRRHTNVRPAEIESRKRQFQQTRARVHPTRCGDAWPPMKLNCY